MKYSEVIAPVSRREGMTVACPLCEAIPGEPCVYIADIYHPYSYDYGTRRLKHHKGSKITEVVHRERMEVIRRKRHAEWERQGSAKRVSALPHLHSVIAAMRAWDIDEHNKLRDWLAEYGDVLAYANLPRRPDGTVRGDSYALPSHASEAALAARYASQDAT